MEVPLRINVEDSVVDDSDMSISEGSLMKPLARNPFQEESSGSSTCYMYSSFEEESEDEVKFWNSLPASSESESDADESDYM